MIRALYTAATGMDAQKTKMDVTAHNLANVNTTGYKSGRAEFAEIFSQTIQASHGPSSSDGGQPAPLQVGLGVKTIATTRSMQQGSLVSTDNPLDMAIEGSGFFRVMRDDGAYAYTRAGNFRVDAAGRVVTVHGNLLEPGIIVPPDAKSLTVTQDGRVLADLPGTTEAMELGTVELAMFSNPGGMESLGDNLFSATSASGEPINVIPGRDGAGRLAQGFLEGSNVQAVTEMIDLISTQRAYEMISKVIQAGDQMLQRLTR